MRREKAVTWWPAAPFADELRAAAVEPGDIIDQAVLLWRVIATVASGYAERHPDWQLRRYEDLAAEPTTSLPELARSLGCGGVTTRPPRWPS
ncbi:MAG: hypothetical protein AAGA17_20600 [Actinomycetota bacterium]